MSQEVRRIQAKDRAAILRLLAGTEAFLPHELDVAMELVDTALNKPEQTDYQPYVIDNHGEIVAYACFGRNPMTRSTYDLYWIATLADRMRQGHGRALLRFVEQEVQRQGGRLLVIETSSKESYGGSRDFYTSTGYQLAGRLPDFYDVGDDRVIYFKRLPETVIL
jgi:ribosomal protein S18 acetylase RimI-like enzyme